MSQAPSDPMVAEFLIDAGYTPANQANVTSVLNRFHAWLRATHGVDDLLDATRIHCFEYLESRRGEISARTGRPISETTRQGDWRQLRAFYAWAEREGELDGRSPMARIPAPRVVANPPTKAASTDDYHRLLAVFGDDELGRRNKAMVSLMFRSGVRRGELPTIDLAHWDERAAMITIPHPKNNQSRRVPVDAETLSFLRRYLRRRGRNPGPLFRGATHTADRSGRIKPRAVADVVERATRRAGVDISPHQLRRAFAGNWLRSNASQAALEVVGGWKDSRMVRRYMADQAEEIAAAEFRAKVDTGAAKRRKPRLRAV